MNNNFKEIVVFAKAQFSAFCGGIVDYLVMIVLTEFFGIHYTLSIVCGGLIGAIVNFWINRQWTFKTDNPAIMNQLLKFSVVVSGSIFLKSSGTYLLTEFTNVDYKITRLIVDAFVCFGFNYFLQKKWVFSSSPKA